MYLRFVDSVAAACHKSLTSRRPFQWLFRLFFGAAGRSLQDLPAGPQGFIHDRPVRQTARFQGGPLVFSGRLGRAGPRPGHVPAPSLQPGTVLSSGVELDLVPGRRRRAVL